MREREQSRSRELYSGSGGSVCVATDTTREPSERTFLYSCGLMTLVRAREGAAELRGDVARLLERSGCEADVRGQRRGPPAHRVAHAGLGFPSPPRLSPILRLA